MVMKGYLKKSFWMGVSNIKKKKTKEEEKWHKIQFHPNMHKLAQFDLHQNSSNSESKKLNKCPRISEG